jgi:hypothetical protein
LAAARSVVGMGGSGSGELGQAGLEQSGVDVGEQHRVVAAGVGEPVAVCAGDAGDEPVGAEAASVVYLAGDLVAAPGMRGEVSINSALVAARLASDHTRRPRSAAAGPHVH